MIKNNYESNILDKNSIGYKSLFISDSKNLKEAISKLNKSGKKILFVKNKKNKILGSLSDGDIRTSLINGYGLNDNIKKFINNNFIYIKNLDEIKKKLKIIKREQIKFVPICCKDKKIINIIDFSLNFSFIKNTSSFFILAGGLGKRMKYLTKKKPKPMLLINKKPIIEHIIIKAKKQGFENFTISLGYLGHQIKKYFKDGSNLGVKISYIFEKKKLGTAGFLSLSKIKHSENFIVTNGDTLTNINYIDLLNFHINNKSMATMAIQKKKNSEKLGVVHTKGNNFLNIIEKPINTYNINSGIYVLNKNSLKYLKKNKHMDMTNFFNLLKEKKKKIMVFPIFENWLDIANQDDLKRANKDFKEYL